VSLIVPDFTESVVVRHATAEVIGQQPITVRLPADSRSTIVITPGVERFEYFRHLERIAYGKVPPESLPEVQELYDTYFRTSPTWDA
jgi:hypothetical protein